jgi:hypothetical protein
MRGSHPGSFEVAHELGGVGPTEWGTTHEGDAGVYDLVFVVHMERFPKGANPAASSYDQHRAGRYEMLEESFESIERETRLQLGGILSAGGFDPARDIAAIAVNRWPHGYANWSSPLSGGGADAERAHRLALHEVPADEYDFRQMRWTQGAAIGVAASGLVLSYLLIVFYVTPYQEARGVPMEGGRLSWRTGEALLALGWAALYVPCGFVACWMIGRSYGSAGRRR